MDPEVILNKFFSKEYVVQRSSQVSGDMVQGRYIDTGELRRLVEFAYQEGIKRGKKAKRR